MDGLRLPPTPAGTEAGRYGSLSQAEGRSLTGPCVAGEGEGPGAVAAPLPDLDLAATAMASCP